MTETKQLAASIALALAAACAGAPTAGAFPDTLLSASDRGGDSMPGDYELWSTGAKDECNASGIGCAVNVPEGDYMLTFTKVRFGRLVTSGGGNAGGERGTGCLRARIHVVPGQPVYCKQREELNCAAYATETMDCGAASVSARERQRRPEPAPAPTAPATPAPTAPGLPAATAPAPRAAPTTPATAPAAVAPAPTTAAPAPTPEK